MVVGRVHVKGGRRLASRELPDERAVTSDMESLTSSDTRST